MFRIIAINNSLVFTKSCNFRLIAIGLEQFIPYLSQGSFFKTSKGDVQIKHAVNYVQKYLLPVKQSKVIYKHVIIHKQPRAEPNPIKYYFEHKRAPLTQHYYKPLNLLGVVPPKDRSEDVLPYQWKEYIHSQYKKQEVSVSFIGFSHFPASEYRMICIEIQNILIDKV